MLHHFECLSCDQSLFSQQHQLSQPKILDDKSTIDKHNVPFKLIKSNLHLGTTLCFVACSNQMVTGYTWDSQMRVPGDKIDSKSLPTEPLL